MSRVLAAALAVVLVADAHAQSAAPKTSFTGDVGIISASGNTQLRTLSVGDKIVHTNGRWILSQLGAYIYGESNDASTANQLRLAARSDYLWDPLESTCRHASLSIL